jgi:hypothetical protein
VRHVLSGADYVKEFLDTVDRWALCATCTSVALAIALCASLMKVRSLRKTIVKKEMEMETLLTQIVHLRRTLNYKKKTIPMLRANLFLTHSTAYS